MIDFHSHIVYDVDDGSDTIENSINILQKAKDAGFTSIVLTPHYMKEYYECDVEQIKQRIQLISNKCIEENIDIKLYQANEVYITNKMIELLQDKKISSINGSRYILFELPMGSEPPNLLEVIYNLLSNKKVPIIAHPERYTYIQKNPNKLLELLGMGVLFQMNYGSILGQYGKDVKKTAKTLLKNGYIHFLGSDTHKTGHIYDNMDKLNKKLRKIISDEQFEKLTKINAEKVLRNEIIEM